jgi:putative flavoprotein involved in K+ transport
MAINRGRMTERIETVIVGGGQAGLAVSYYLQQMGREHVIFEQAARVANTWRNDRWDSFTLLTPNWSFRLPGAEYHGDAPDGFMARDEILTCFEQFLERNNLPVQFGVNVESVMQGLEKNVYLINTGKKTFWAKNVVIATGLFQSPKIPAFSTAISQDVLQLPSGKYRNPQTLPDGAVLVVGSAQSGSQIAEEIYLNGRKVYLCVSGAGRVPRRYRGKDIYEWMRIVGILDRTVDQLPSSKAKFAANPHVTGRDGGRTLNLHKFALDGVVLLGHIRDAQQNHIWLEPDLNENLKIADKFEADLTNQIDSYILKNGLTAPEEELPELRNGFTTRETTEMDLRAAGITTIIWAIGYKFNFDLIKLPVLDGDGFPIQTRGVTNYPGLFFVGLPWLYKYKSGHLFGVGEDAKYIALKIAGKEFVRS